VEGREWKEKHEPEVMIDVKVGLSCLLFLSVSAFMYALGDYVGAVYFGIVTLFSTLSDAVYVNHYYLNFTDRITAAGAVIYMLWTTTEWILHHDDWTHPLAWFKLIFQVASALIPFKFLDKCREHPVRSENWRDFHVKWHVAGSVGMIICLFVNHGFIEETCDMITASSFEIVQTLAAFEPIEVLLQMAE